MTKSNPTNDKRKLAAGERLSLLGLLPQKGTISTVRLRNELQSKLGFNAKEQEAFDRCQTAECTTCGRGFGIDWDELTKAVPPKTIGFNGFEIGLIAAELKKLDEAEELQSGHEALWNHFCEKET